ncbi:MAG: DUF1800 family protein, partial [Lysobacter sp.]
FTVRLDHDRSNDFMYRFAFTGHEPYAWPAPNGYPDTSLAWSGANGYAMSWKMLNWLSETNDAGVPLLPVVELSRTEVASWTASNLVDHWCRRLLGYLPAAARRQEQLAFMAQNGNPTVDVIADSDAWNANNLKQHYNHQRLRSMVSLIMMTPEFLSR